VFWTIWRHASASTHASKSLSGQSRTVNCAELAACLLLAERLGQRHGCLAQ
jgi:hypothetical protein